MKDEDILKQSRERLRACIDAEADVRQKMRDDLHFATIDQWDDKIRKARESDPNGARPCLTIDKISQYILQVVNEMRQNRAAIKVRPVDDSADIETAEIYQGLVRHIEDQSSAYMAYETAGEWAVKVGLGYLRIVADRPTPESFDQELFVRRIPSTFSVYLGPHIVPDGSDSEFGFVFEDVPIGRFKREHPKAKLDKAAFEGLGEHMGDWLTDTTVKVAEYYYFDYEERNYLYLEDGSSMPENDYWDAYKDGPRPQVTGNNNARIPKLRWCKHTGAEILDKRELPGKYIPIVEVIGREAYVDGKRELWGLVRPAKDSLRAYNYWISTITEKIGLAPKMPYIGAKGAFDGVELDWASANRENKAYLEYNTVDVEGKPVPAPQRVQPSQVEAGMMAMLPLLEHDVQTALGMFKASVGEEEGSQSGRAILALQRESDTSTFHFQDNVANGIKHCGRILVDLIPHYYDKRRVIRILGEDGEAETATIDPEQQESVRRIRDQQGKVQRIYNLGVGKFDVTVTVGPSYNTKRMEAAEAMLRITDGKPEVLQIMGDLMFKAFDWPMADQIAERFKRMLPPQLQDNEEQQPIPPQVQAKVMQMQQAVQVLQQENASLQSGEKQAQAKIAAQHQEAMAQLTLKAQAQQEEERLAREKALREAEFQVWKATLDAETQIRVAQIRAAAQPVTTQ